MKRIVDAVIAIEVSWFRLLFPIYIFADYLDNEFM